MNEKDKLRRSAKLHRAAMEHADDALLARHAGDQSAALKHTEQAYEKEAAAAELIRHDLSHQMNAILHRSAATLAFRCGKFHEAEDLIIHGLVADPDAKLRQELHNLLIDVRFHDWLGSSLPVSSSNELVMTLTGTEADSGTIEVASFASHITSCKGLLLNSVGHVSNRPFGDLRKLGQNYRILTAPPSTGSFKINVQLVEIQQPLPGFEMVEMVYDNFLRSFRILENGDTSSLQARFKDDDYFHDFMILARALAPDGNRISALSFEAEVKGTREKVVFDRTQEEIDSIYSSPQQQKEEPAYRITTDKETVVGTLRFANAMKDEKQLKLVPDDGKPWDIIVSNDINDEVIRDHFGYLVRVTGRHMVKRRKSRRLYLDHREGIRKVTGHELAELL